MGLALLGAGWLWALPLAAAPIALHLAWRQRRRRVQMPSLVFFQRLDPRLHARRRLRDRLILALRCLAILAVVLALAQPVWQGWGGGRAAVAIVIDTSASMSMPAGPGGQTRLQAALEDAGALVGELRDGDRAAILTTVPDLQVPVLPAPIGDRARLRALLDAIHPTGGASDPAAVVLRAHALLASAGPVQRTTLILTDLQAHDWDAAGTAAVPVDASARLLIARVPAQAPASQLAIQEILLPPHGVVANRPVPLRLTLANAGPAAAAAACTASDDAGRSATAVTSVPAHGRAAMTLVLPGASAGSHWARVTLAGAATEVLGEGFTAFHVAPARTVVLVGDAAAYGLLPLALAPGGSGAFGIALTRVDPAGLAAALGVDTTLVAMTLDQAAHGLPDALVHWVEGGGTLVVLPADAAAAAPVPALPGLGLTTAVVGLTPPAPLVVLEARADALGDCADAGDNLFATVRVASALTLGLPHPGPWRSVLGLTDGRTLLAALPRGAGRILVSGLALDQRWSSLPLDPACVALVQGWALPRVAVADARAVRCGEPVTMPWRGPVHLLGVAGPALDWQGTLVDGLLPPLARPGVVLAQGGGQATLLAAAADPGEADATIRTGLTAPPALPGAEVVEGASPSAVVAAWRRGERGGSLVVPLLVLAAAALLGEGLLASLPSVRRPVAPARLGRAA